MNRETVLSEHRDGVALLTLNRPSKRNAFSQQYDDLRDALRTPGRNTIKVTVITGAPGAFSPQGRTWLNGASGPDGMPMVSDRSSIG